jgi:hypothetical protein
MSLQMQTFNAFTPSMFAAFAAKIKADIGIDLAGATSGTVEHGSFTFQYTYDPTKLVLNIQCLKKPLFIPASTIVNGIAEEVATLRGATSKV